MSTRYSIDGRQVLRVGSEAGMQAELPGYPPGCAVMRRLDGDYEIAGLGTGRYAVVAPGPTAEQLAATAARRAERQKREASVVRAIATGMQRGAQSTRPAHLKSLLCTLPESFESEEIPAQQYAIHNLYPLGCVSALLGAGKVGKSTLILSQMLHIAAGREWEGLRVQAGIVYYLSGEDKFDEVRRRIQRIAKQSQFTADELAAIRKNFRVLNCVGQGFQLVDVQHGQVTISKTVDALVEDILTDRPVLVVVDTVSRFLGADENSNTVMARLVSALERLAEQSQAACVAVHHVSKQAKRNGIVDSSASRGGDALPSNSRSSCIVTLVTSAEVAKFDAEVRALAAQRRLVKLTHIEQSYGPTIHSMFFQRTDDGVLERIRPKGDMLSPFEKWFSEANEGKPFSRNRVEVNSQRIWGERCPSRTDVRAWFDRMVERTAFVLSGKGYVLTPNSAEKLVEQDAAEFDNLEGEDTTDDLNTGWLDE
jgi:hypothetical protein